MSVFVSFIFTVFYTYKSISFSSFNSVLNAKPISTAKKVNCDSLIGSVSQNLENASHSLLLKKCTVLLSRVEDDCKL
jgi:hypothetical protein